jgi:hypothetical protein
MDLKKESNSIKCFETFTCKLVIVFLGPLIFRTTTMDFYIIPIDCNLRLLPVQEQCRLINSETLHRSAT